MNRIVPIFALIFLAGCAGKVTYTPPTQVDREPNVKKVFVSKRDLWPGFIKSLSSKFFIINNIDESSGLINVSYSGRPENYVSCGTPHASPHFEAAGAV